MIDNSNFLSPERRITAMTSAEVLAMTEANRAKEALSVLAKTRGAIGLTDAQILLALADGTDNWDPFGILLTFIGNMVRFFGSTITCAVVLFSMYLFASWVRDKIRDLTSWLSGWVTSLIPGASFIITAGKALGLLDADPTSARAAQLAGASFQGMIMSFMPSPISSLMPTMMSDFLGGGVGNLSSLNVNTGSNSALAAATPPAGALPSPYVMSMAAANPTAPRPAAPSSPTGIDALLASAGTALGNAAGGAIGSVLGNIFGTADSQPSDAQINEVARITGADPNRVRALLNL